ncbi:MAG TPA: aspartate kinase [Spirochaetota bacterium]|nr:aspartate kinase [Spirochaetota bacterium]
MKKKIVSKFGGSSVANAEQIEKVRNIVASNTKRKFVVVSAPGKDADDSEKVTDHLFNIATEGKHFREQKKKISPKKSYDAVVAKFKKIISNLGINADDIIKDIETDLQRSVSDRNKIDFFASRGEHFNAKIIARYFQSKGMKAEACLPEDYGFIVSHDFGNARVLPDTYKNIKKLSGKNSICVFPGYYGVTKTGEVAVMSRGGSDLTGGEIAYAINAEIYENWTDTDGIYQVDPRLITDADIITRLTYKELRLLASKGFNVFHYDAMVNCKKENIPISIRNTNNPSAPGTMIVSERVPEETVIGISRLDNIAYVYLEKDMLGETIGFAQDLLKIFRDNGINTYHYPTDKDDIAVLVNQDNLTGQANDLKDEIMNTFKPDVIEIKYNLSIISPVGIGMKDQPGILATTATALKEKNINIETVDQSPSQMSVHFGIQTYYAEGALRAIYDAFLR